MGRINHTGHDLDLGNTVGVTEDNTDLGGGGTLLGQLADVVHDLVGGGLEPRRSGAGVGDGRGGNALALAVQATHFWWWCGGPKGSRVLVGWSVEKIKMLPAREFGVWTVWVT